MGKKVAVVIKDKDRQYEGLRTSLGLLLEDHQVSMVVLNHEIALDEAYVDNLAFVGEMEGECLSNVDENVKKHGFKKVTVEEMATRLSDYEIVIPF